MFVNHCGINFTHQSFHIDRPSGSHDYLFLYTKAPAYFTLDGVDVYAPKYTVFLYRKDSPQYFRGAERIYINDYIHFNTQDASDEKFINSLELTYDTPLSLTNVNSFMNIQQQIVHETKNRSPWSSIAIDSLLKYFLIKLSEAMSLSNKNYETGALERLNLLRNRIYKEPSLEWSVRMMAEEVNFSPSYFQALYKSMFNTACMTDVIYARIELAKNLLILTDSTSREISAMCGYQNETHFSRQFKKITGKSPQEYRKGSQ